MAILAEKKTISVLKPVICQLITESVALSRMEADKLVYRAATAAYHRVMTWLVLFCHIMSLVYAGRVNLEKQELVGL